jgi:hypothetical protein
VREVKAVEFAAGPFERPRANEGTAPAGDVENGVEMGVEMGTEVVTAPVAVVPATDIERLVCSYAWPCIEALTVMWCESGGRPDAIGFGNNYGLFQINVLHAPALPGFWESWADPAWNTAVAYGMYQARGWTPWSCAR